MMNRKAGFRLLSFFIKLLILLITLTYLVRQFLYKDQIEDIKEAYKTFLHPSLAQFYLFLTGILMFVNWGLEAFKWKLMISNIENISFKRAYKAILSGVTISLFTPNRVGEYGGRVFYLSEENRIKGIFITVLTSISQLLITILVGSVALLYYVFSYRPINWMLQYGAVSLMFLVSFFLLLAYFNAAVFNVIFLRIPFLKKLIRYSRVIGLYNHKQLFTVLVASLVRYMVFALQFFFLLRAFHIDISLFLAFELITMIFLVTTIIPTFTFSELGIRGSVAVFFLGQVSSNIIGIVAASFGLWIINLVIPAIIGLVFIFNLKLFSKD